MGLLKSFCCIRFDDGIFAGPLGHPSVHNANGTDFLRLGWCTRVIDMHKKGKVEFVLEAQSLSPSPVAG